MKVKVLHFNNNAFMTKSLRKAITLRSWVKNSFNKKRSDENWDNYRKQRNFWVKLLPQTKKYFSDLKSKVFLTTKILEKHKINFSQCLRTNNIILVENKETARKEEIIANIMKNYFTNITTHQKLKSPKNWPQSESRKHNKYLPKSWKCLDD